VLEISVCKSYTYSEGRIFGEGRLLNLFGKKKKK